MGIGITSDIIGSIKGVKVARLSDKAETQIQGLRDFELEQSTMFRKLNVVGVVLGTLIIARGKTQLTDLGMIPTFLLPAVTFTVYAIAQRASGGSQLNVALAFTSFSLLSLLVVPIMDLTSSIPSVAASMACLSRIQEFLLKERREDYRTLFVPGPASPDNSDAGSTSGKGPWIKIRGATFSWAKEGTPVVKDVDFDIRPGELTLIVGPVASGKSTLLKALLGEACMISGSVEFTVPEELAYCDQEVWLLNQSIRQNILAFKPYDEALYHKVVQACQLEEDLEQLPQGDKTMIGSKGISLSGGQKQRVVGAADQLC